MIDVKQIIVSNLQQRINNPMAQNMLNLYQSGDMEGFQNVARNYMNTQGRNYDEELKKYKGMLGIK